MLLGQFIYTSFPDIGFKLLATQGMSHPIQSDLVRTIVSQYWDDHNPPPPHYRAVYLYQPSLNDCLFGWLYNNGQDDLGRHNTPYFVGHHLPISLNSILVELIFLFLFKGPAVNTHLRTVTTLEELNLPDLWTYQPQRPGVLVSDIARAKCHEAIRDGRLVDMFTSVADSELVAEINEDVCEALIAGLTKYLGPVARIVVWQAMEESTHIVDPYQRAQWMVGRLCSELLDSSAEPTLRQEIEQILYLNKPPLKSLQKATPNNPINFTKLRPSY
jgi:hypothetical protein